MGVNGEKLKKKKKNLILFELCLEPPICLILLTSLEKVRQNLTFLTSKIIF